MPFRYQRRICNFKVPAAAFRGLANKGSPASAFSWFKRLNTEKGIRISPRISNSGDNPLSTSRVQCDRPDISRDIVSLHAVSPGNRLSELTVHISQTNRSPVVFNSQTYCTGHRPLSAPADRNPAILLRYMYFQRKHRIFMSDLSNS